VFFEKLEVAQLFKKSSSSMGPERSLPYTQEPANGIYLKPDEFSPQHT
jgi:hypothetical protein